MVQIKSSRGKQKKSEVLVIDAKKNRDISIQDYPVIITYIYLSITIDVDTRPNDSLDLINSKLEFH